MKKAVMTWPSYNEDKFLLGGQIFHEHDKNALHTDSVTKNDDFCTVDVALRVVQYVYRASAWDQTGPD